MSKKLLIIESPTKARTLRKYVGADFKIVASMGHIKDLPVSRLGVDIERGFEPHYEVVKGKAKVLKELKEAAKEAEAIYLAPDPDREGEAIAWHIAGELDAGKRPMYRVLFNELTGKAIREAMERPQSLNRDKFESQQARRILDRLVGYLISPLLWSKIKSGLSAGRVQSVALRMICDREREIFAFQTEEYWSLTAHLKAADPPEFEARLLKWHGKKAALKTREDVDEVLGKIEGKPFLLGRLVKRDKKKNPPPPFITSLLQQEAYNRLRFSAKKTMSVAQSLYEGVEIGDKGQIGLITYMRTDSFRMSEEAIAEARAYIGRTFGEAFLPPKPNHYRSREGAQEAHEAIRPTVVDLEPEQIKRHLSTDQYQLYSLIWRRFVACQMQAARLAQTQADIEVDPALFRATGTVMVFKGFTAVYEEALGDEAKAKDEERRLPPLHEGQALELLRFEPAQHFTQPPPRYTEATLIKALEANGIGRPSTYATILANINGRAYVTLQERRFRPTELGFLVTDLLVKGFPDILDTSFTAQMESTLDRVEKGDTKWKQIIGDFYGPFERSLEKAQKERRFEVPTPVPCPQCGRPVAIKAGKNGVFLACSGFPDCRYSSNFVRDEKGNVVPVAEKKEETPVGTCDRCGRPMVTKTGRNGPFLACSGYPECKNIGSLPPKGTGVHCPEPGCPGSLVERVSKKGGKKFFACDQFPACRFAMWEPPHEGTCPLCGTPVLRVKQTPSSGVLLVCRKPGCRYREPLPTEGGPKAGEGVTGGSWDV